MKIGIVIASYGRSELLQQQLSAISRQMRTPDEIVLSVVRPEDVGAISTFDLNVNVIYSGQGSCAQRNTGLEFLEDRADVVLFMDDDFWMSSTYLRELERIFSMNNDIVATTGYVLADGATSAGISVQQAEQYLEDHERAPTQAVTVRDVPDTYGCNMAFRKSAIGDVRFDERMPLYGWQEDVDFSAQLRSRGRIVWTDALCGVHLGTKKGKTSGLRFGYSQVINPLYIFKKGNMPLQRAMLLISKNMAANAAKSFFPEQYVDRWGRLKGNMIGLLHAVSGKLDPMHVLKL